MRRDLEKPTNIVVRGDLRTETGKMLVVARRTLQRPPEILTEEDTDLWFGVFQAAGVDPGDVMPALIAYMEKTAWFPAPAQIIACVRTIESKRESAARSERRRRERMLKELEAAAERERWESLTPDEQQTETDSRLAARERVRRRFPALFGDDAVKPARPAQSEQETNPHGKTRRLHADEWKAFRDFAAGDYPQWDEAKICE